MNKFGRSLPTSSRQKGVRVLQAPNLIAVIKDGEYNIRDHRLCNVKSPTEDSDAVNRKFVDSAMWSLSAKIDNSVKDCVKLIETNFNNLQQKCNESIAVNQKYIDFKDEQQRALLKSVNDDILKLSNSFATAEKLHKQANSIVENRFSAMNVEFEKIKSSQEKLIEDLKPQFDLLEEMLNSSITMMIQKYQTPWDAKFTQIKKELSQLIKRVDSLESSKN